MINILRNILSIKIYNLLFIIILGIVLYNILIMIINKILLLKMKLNKRKMKTIQILLKNIIRYTIFIIILLFILDMFGVNTTALITSIGILSLIIGLALQDILKDILAGIFILFEDQYAIGDIVEINGFKGEVISLGIRITKIRSDLGETKIIANRNVNEVINYSLHDSLLVIDIDVAYDTDLDLADKVFADLTKTLSKKIDGIKSDFKFLGIQNLGDYITYRITVQTEPMKHLEIKRIVLKEIKKALDKNNIKRK